VLSKIRQIASYAGINKATGFSLLARGWQIIAGPVTMLLVAHYFNLAQQGFYYTFSSVLALQVVFELGLAFVITQFASHEFTALSWGDEGQIHGEQKAINRFHAILRRSVIWYGGVALLMALFVLPAGLFFFGSHETVGHAVSWQAPWIALVLAASAYLPITPILAAIEGSGQVARVNRLRLIQGVCASVTVWAAIAGGAGLFAASITFAVNVIVGYGWVARNYPALLRAVRHEKEEDASSSFSWKREVWPMQWRIAVSWISGYLIFQLFTPILFYYHGPAMAGKMGMSLVIANMLNSVALVWLQANTPVMAQSVARSDWKMLDRVFTQVFWQSVAVSLTGSFVVLAGLKIFSAYPLAQRMLPLSDMAYLLMAFSLSHVIGALAHYLRMHKREPFMLLSILGAIQVALAMWYFGRLYGSTGMVMSLLLINLVYGLPSALWLWQRLRKAWHQPTEQINE
jgi:hypothetical protein